MQIEWNVKYENNFNNLTVWVLKKAEKANI